MVLYLILITVLEELHRTGQFILIPLKLPLFSVTHSVQQFEYITRNVILNHYWQQLKVVKVWCHMNSNDSRSHMQSTQFAVICMGDLSYILTQLLKLCSSELQVS